ncbi:Lhy protein, partial [Globisporangium splendens]
MDIGASRELSNTSVDEYAKENYNSQHQQQSASSMLAPQQPPMLLKKEQQHEPWRGPSSFGLANILNQSIRNSSSTSSSASASLPKFSLPSLHSFGANSLLVKPELSIGAPQHSLLNPTPPPRSPASTPPPPAPSHSSEARHMASHTSDGSSDRKSNPGSASKETTPLKAGAGASRRIAPAPADDEDGDQDEELSGSIRGGRWTADEHERFLAGFRIHGHKWKRVQQVVRTRSVTQVRTHAQKYLLKVAKLKAEKKQGKSIDVASLNDRYLSGRGGDSSSDVEQSNTAPNSPEGARGMTRYYDDSVDAGGEEPSPKRTPRKKMRHHAEHVDILDQEYIAAAATTLCFLMSQKIDSLFDNRHDMDNKDLEPYDCYTTEQHAAPASGTAGEDGVFAENSRKRTYMHFLTDTPVPYETEATHFAYDDKSQQRSEPSSYTIEGKKLYS